MLQGWRRYRRKAARARTGLYEVRIDTIKAIGKMGSSAALHCAPLVDVESVAACADSATHIHATARLAEEWHVELSSCVLYFERFDGGAVREHQGAALRDPHDHRTAHISQWDAVPQATSRVLRSATQAEKRHVLFVTEHLRVRGLWRTRRWTIAAARAVTV